MGLPCLETTDFLLLLALSGDVAFGRRCAQRLAGQLLIIYNEMMEKKQIFYKIGRIPSSNTSRLDSELDFEEPQSKQESGAEINRNAPQHKFESAHFSPESSLPQQEGTLGLGRKSKRGKYSNDSSGRELDAQLGRSKPQKQNKWKILRIRELVSLFLEKASLNIVSRPPISYSPFERQPKQLRWLLHFPCPALLVQIACLLKLAFSAIYLFLFPLSLLYSELERVPLIIALKCLSLLLALFDCLQALHQKENSDNTVHINQEKEQEQFRDRRWKFLMALLTALFSSVSIAWREGHYFFLGALLGLIRLEQQIQSLQDRFLTQAQIARYWSLLKVVIKNILVCHLLAVSLLWVSRSEQHSWMTERGLDLLSWSEQYIWSYYFGTTIILTIGFGDLHATNPSEALLLIVLSFLACIFFGYNINYIGNLINSMQQEEQQKRQKLKLFRSLARKADISAAAEHEIASFISQQAKIKQQSNYTQQKKLLKELPDSLRSTFLREANVKLFNHLRDFIPLSNRSIERLSLQIQARFCHPQQNIKNARSSRGLVILQSGEVGFTARSNYPSKLSGAVIQRISNSINSQSKMVCLDFLEHQTPSYDLTSLDYSVIYELGRQGFEACVAECGKDYQVYRELLDGCRYKLNQFALVRCRYCQKPHSLFECPRLHFIPLRNTLPKSLVSVFNFKQPRKPFERKRDQLTCQIIYPSSSMSEDSTSQKSCDGTISLQNSGISQRRTPSWKGSRKCLRPSSDNMFMTIQMVSQLRSDIQSLKRNSSQMFEFDLWTFPEADQAANFDYYFPRFNPTLLGQRQIKQALLTKSYRFRRVNKSNIN